MEDIEDKRRQEAYVNFAKLAMRNSSAYEGSKNIEAKIKRIEAIKAGLSDVAYKSVYQSETCDEMLLGSDESEVMATGDPKLVKSIFSKKNEG